MTTLAPLYGPSGQGSELALTDGQAEIWRAIFSGETAPAVYPQPASEQAADVAGLDTYDGAKDLLKQHALEALQSRPATPEFVKPTPLESKAMDVYVAVMLAAECVVDELDRVGIEVDEDDVARVLFELINGLEVNA